MRPRGISRILCIAIAFACVIVSAQSPGTNSSSKAQDWQALAKLPDWSGVWLPDLANQDMQIRANPVPWKPEIAKEIRRLIAAERQGHPKGLFANCLPEGMPSWMLISHNAMEFVF